jgi:uncharacterized caspase-like protein
VGLFYFAGRGVQIDGDMYLLPLRMRFEQEQDVREKALPVRQVLGSLAAASYHLTIVILDTSRNNPFLRREQSMRQRLTVMDASPGTFIAYATAPGGAASEGQERNSIYTKYLLRSLATPGLSLEELFRQVRRGVEEETSGYQTTVGDLLSCRAVLSGAYASRDVPATSIFPCPPPPTVPQRQPQPQ